MKTTCKLNLLVGVLVCAVAHSGITPHALAQKANFDKLANFPFAENRPTKETSQILHDELLFQRATQISPWAMPLINTLGMQVGSEKVFGSGYNVLPIWKKRLDAKTFVTTPNSDALYAMSYAERKRLVTDKRVKRRKRA